jgi:hypothetical protein
VELVHAAPRCLPYECLPTCLYVRAPRQVWMSSSRCHGPTVNPTCWDSRCPLALLANLLCHPVMYTWPAARNSYCPCLTSWPSRCTRSAVQCSVVHTGLKQASVRVWCLCALCSEPHTLFLPVPFHLPMYCAGARRAGSEAERPNSAHTAASHPEQGGTRQPGGPGW